ncbi:MAG: methyltransferase [Mobilicoccus sp.]|nr:methyltransferase [Mobilicoccus sp.]
MTPAPPVLTDDLTGALRADLHAAGYTVENVNETLGPVASRALIRDHVHAARRALGASTGALPTLLRLFALGDVVSSDGLDAAMPSTGIDGLRRIGLVIDAPGGVRAACDLRPYGDEDHTWWVASDLGEVATGTTLRADHVLGVGGASLTLASWTPRTPVGSVLDLGTGCGIQALHAAGHAEHVVATDLSERALAYAAFNAALSGERWDLRAGDLFAPVTGERFDLVVSNPPFVISPRGADLPLYEYRDGGRAGDELVASVVRDVGAHLRDGGTGVLLVNWEVAHGETWRDRWHALLAEPGCADLDAWVIARERQDVAEYAETWARDSGERPGTDDYDRWVEAWLEDFAGRGVDAIWFGVLVVRRRGEGPRWIDLTEATGPVDAPMGPHVARGMEARTLLAGLDDDALLARRWQVAPDVTEERHTRPGSDHPSVILVRQGGGLRRAVRADTALAAFVSVCDGDLPAGVAVTAIAALLDEPAGDVRGRIVGPLRELVADGLLTEASAPDVGDVHEMLPDS